MHSWAPRPPQAHTSYMTPDTDTLLREAKTIKNEDCRQDYLLARLEGKTIEEARKLSGPTKAPLHMDNPQRGPRGGAPNRFGNYRPPFTSDFGLEGIEVLRSFTQDARTEEEQDLEEFRADVLLPGLLSLLTVCQHEVIVRIYGIDRPRMTYQEAAEDLGISVKAVDCRQDSALKKLRKATA